MPCNLRDLDVEFVSLVDRAAVRNAERPDEPQRFLIFKRADAQGEAMTQDDAISEALTTLRPYGDNPRVAAALQKLEAPAGDDDDNPDDQDDVDVEKLAKSLEHAHETGGRVALSKAAPDQLAYLRHMSPAAAAAWERAARAAGR
jgi:hypothetical protein